jgi:hypothetical protein
MTPLTVAIIFCTVYATPCPGDPVPFTIATVLCTVFHGYTYPCPRTLTDMRDAHLVARPAELETQPDAYKNIWNHPVIKPYAPNITLGPILDPTRTNQHARRPLRLHCPLLPRRPPPPMLCTMHRGGS